MGIALMTCDLDSTHEAALAFPPWLTTPPDADRPCFRRRILSREWSLRGDGLRPALRVLTMG